jgi:O-antigen ligase
MGAVSALAFIASVLTFSRGLMGGLLIALIGYAILARLSIWRLTLAATAVALGTVVAWFLAKDVLIDVEDRQIDLADIVANRLSEANVESRLEGYRETFALIDKRPLLGHGAGFYDPGYGASLLAVHNAYLEQWKYFGVVLGTVTSLCYLALVLYFFQLRRKAPQLAVLTDAMACGWLFLALTSSVETFFEATVPRAVIYIFLGVSVSMVAETWLSRRQTSSRGSWGE